MSVPSGAGTPACPCRLGRTNMVAWLVGSWLSLPDGPAASHTGKGKWFLIQLVADRGGSEGERPGFYEAGCFVVHENAFAQSERARVGGMCKVSPPTVLVRRQPFFGPLGQRGWIGHPLHLTQLHGAQRLISG